MRYEILHLKEAFPFLGEQDRDPTVTLLLPDNLAVLGRENDKRPCLIICPGGGYRITCPKESEPIAFHFLPEGYNVFILHYSTTPSCFPTQHREVAALLELIHQNTDTWHCDTKRVALMGFSAGGHLAAHYANCYDHPQIRELFPDSKPVQASILCYAVLRSAAASKPHSLSVRRIAGTDDPTPEQIDFFSCEKQVSERTPPTFLWHCAGDKSVSVDNSLIYAQALAAHHVPFDLHVYSFGAHDLCTGDEQTNNSIAPTDINVKNWLPAVKNWLKVIL